MVQGDGSGDGTFSLEFDGGVASVPFSAGAAVLLAAIEANLTDPTGSLQDTFVSLEEASSTKRSYLVTFPRELGDVPTMVAYGDSEISSVTVTEEVHGSVQVTMHGTCISYNSGTFPPFMLFCIARAFRTIPCQTTRMGP